LRERRSGPWDGEGKGRWEVEVEEEVM